MKQQELEDRLIDFAVEIIEIGSNLKKSKAGITIEGQIVRSCTSTALNYGEVQGAESSKDFIHKLQIVLKELRETLIALKIINRAKLSNDPVKVEKGMGENNELISIFVKTILTAKRNRR